MGWLLRGALTLLMGLGCFCPADAGERVKAQDLWSLKPIVRPAVPQGAVQCPNPIDAFLAETQSQRGVVVTGPADRLTWLRRVHFDLVGLPPSVEAQERFLADVSDAAVAQEVDRLLASEQHGVRYGRHWLDVLRYADLDEFMPSESGIHLWRDWVIEAMNQDLPYDQFVRAQVCGNRAARRQIISPAGHLTKVEARPEDVFAQGFLARGAMTKANADHELAFSAVDTISVAFLGMTVGCAKCHDHFYDPIFQKDFYAMKALFDPLVLHPIELATAEQVFAHGRAMKEFDARQQPLVEAMRRFIEPIHSRLYEERLQMMPPDVQAAIRKPEAKRNAAEQKIYEDYYPILRIDPPKIKALMSSEQVKTYDGYLKQINELKAPEPLPRFWGVREDAQRAVEVSYVLNTGDPKRPKKQQPVEPGFPFAPPGFELRAGRREAFMDWLTAPGNPLFARVAVNRIWAWHFGTPLHASLSDFGALGGNPVHPKLLDWLASEFVAQNYSMKWLHRLIVTSETYRRASVAETSVAARNQAMDPENRLLWKFPLRRLEAEPIYDALLSASGTIDLALGGRAFDGTKEGVSVPRRRAAFMARGYRSSSDVMPDSLATFDAEEGRSVCTRRNETVTPTQALFLMNHPLIENASKELAARLQAAFPQSTPDAVKLGYRLTLGRPPTDAELTRSVAFVTGQPDGLKPFAWLLFNLDEFVYVR